MKGILIREFLEFHFMNQSLYGNQTILKLTKQQCQVIIRYWPNDNIISGIKVIFNLKLCGKGPIPICNDKFCPCLAGTRKTREAILTACSRMVVK